MLTVEKSKSLLDYLASEDVDAEALFTAEPAEALNKINAAGLDFTMDELMQFGQELRVALTTDSELSEEDLDAVAGGIVVSLGLVAAYVVGGLIVGVGVGIAVNAKW